LTNGTIEVRLKSITLEAEGINSYRLEPVAGGLLPAFSAGAHITCHLPASMVRSYSLLNEQDVRDAYVIAVRNDPQGQGGSRHIHENWRVGDTIAIGAPRSNFALVEETRHSLLIAGGIGITPILSMVRRLNRLGRSWQLHYAARSRREAAFLDRLEGLASAAGRAQVTLHGEPGARRLDIPSVVSGAGPDTHLYCCGPARMMHAFEEATKSRPRGNIHVEHFSAVEAPAAEGSYEVVLERSRRTIKVKPGKTLLNTLLEEGVDVQFSCTQGVCGTCETRVLSGTPDHRDLFLSSEERAANKTIMVCCSGSRSPTLVLDL
jgi:tetrachlorobenzoquinone reductase